MNPLQRLLMRDVLLSVPSPRPTTKLAAWMLKRALSPEMLWRMRLEAERRGPGTLADYDARLRANLPGQGQRALAEGRLGAPGEMGDPEKYRMLEQLAGGKALPAELYSQPWAREEAHNLREGYHGPRVPEGGYRPSLGRAGPRTADQGPVPRSPDRDILARLSGSSEGLQGRARGQYLNTAKERREARGYKAPGLRAPQGLYRDIPAGGYDLGGGPPPLPAGFGQPPTAVKPKAPGTTIGDTLRGLGDTGRQLAADLAKGPFGPSTPRAEPVTSAMPIPNPKVSIRPPTPPPSPEVAAPGSGGAMPIPSTGGPLRMPVAPDTAAAPKARGGKGRPAGPVKPPPLPDWHTTPPPVRPPKAPAAPTPSPVGKGRRFGRGSALGALLGAGLGLGGGVLASRYFGNRSQATPAWAQGPALGEEGKAASWRRRPPRLVKQALEAASRVGLGHGNPVDAAPVTHEGGALDDTGAESSGRPGRPGGPGSYSDDLKGRLSDDRGSDALDNSGGAASGGPGQFWKSQGGSYVQPSNALGASGRSQQPSTSAMAGSAPGAAGMAAPPVKIAALLRSARLVRRA